MHGFYYGVQATTSAAVCQCVTADCTLSPSLVYGVNFCSCGFISCDKDPRKLVNISSLPSKVLQLLHLHRGRDWRGRAYEIIILCSKKDGNKKLAGSGRR